MTGEAMGNKSTEELENVLKDVHFRDVGKYLEQGCGIIKEDRPFSVYMRTHIRKKHHSQQEVFLWADIPERYGYKLLSGEKRTRQRDVILRICYAAEFTIEETQRALKLYGMSPLYVRIPRDAVLMVLFRERPGSIHEVNEQLKAQEMEPLVQSGSLD